MSNTNRDYVIVYDVKSSSLTLSGPLVFYITDKNTSNIFVRLVTKTNIEGGVDQYTDIEDASGYILLMRVIKPNDEITNIKATQREQESIFEFDLTENFKDIPGTYICELMISTMVSGRQELITSDSFTYEVKRSVLSKIDQIIEHEDTTVEKLLNEVYAAKAEMSSQVQASDNKIENIKTELSSRLDATKTELSSQISSQIKEIENCKPMNILFLGGKNDGSEDIGAIINNYTDKYSIYLPEGIYKVTTPIVLKNSLIGAGYSRNRYSTNNKGQTWLLSELFEGSLLTIDETMTSTTLTISDLSIQLNSIENGIEIKTGNERPLLNIEKVGIFNVEGVAVNVIPTVSTSRLVMINNLVVFGKAFASESNGIYTNTKCPDCRFTNIEIMGTKYGIIVSSSMYGSDVHIWTGSMKGDDQADWWKGTRGLIVQGGIDARFSNLYLDTCYICIVLRDNSNLNIENFYYWEDNSVASSTAYDGSLFWTSKNCTRYNNIVINNGIINLGQRMGFIKNYHAITKNISYMTNKALTNDTQNIFNFTEGSVKYQRKFAYNDTGSHYVPIVCLRKLGNSYTGKINICMGGAQNIDLFINKLYSSSTPTFKTILNNDAFHEFYYKIDGDLFYIYAKVVELQEFSINGYMGKNIEILDLDSMIKSDRSQFDLTGVQSDTNGLTLIERSN